jgi:predicted AAA+ superfamily ATPase
LFYQNKLLHSKSLYNLRDNNKNEVDVIDDTGSGLRAYEIKASETMKPEFQTNLNEIGDALKVDVKNRAVIYNGQTMRGSGVNFINWREV